VRLRLVGLADRRKRRAQEQEQRELERRSDQEQRNFETTMATIAASIAGMKDK
jgi:hypothetical protein